MDRSLLDRHVVRPRKDQSVLLARRRARAGDVLLTRGRESLSKGVIVATGGQFSHAALHAGAILVDAIEVRGTGPTTLPHASIAFCIDVERGRYERVRRGDESIHFSEDLSDFGNFTGSSVNRS